MKKNAKTLVKVGSLLALFLVIIIFAFARSKDLIFGIKIRGVNITDGAKLAESSMKVKGNARNALLVTLNGREISIDQTGNFDETIALLSGYNIINIRAKDKFGYVDEKNYQLMYIK